MDKFKPVYAIRVSMSDYREQDWIVNIPLWSISGIKEIADIKNR